MEEHTIVMAEMVMKEQMMAMAETMKGEAITDNVMVDGMMEAAVMMVDAKYHLSHKQLFFTSFLWQQSLDGCSHFVRVRSMTVAVAVVVAVDDIHGFFCLQSDQLCHSIPI